MSNAGSPPAKPGAYLSSYNERIFRDLKDPGGVSMVPLRHRRDRTLRAHALIVILGLILAKVLQRRLKRAGHSAPSLASVLGPLKHVQRARVRYGPEAPPVLRALARDRWIPSARTPRQHELLQALYLQDRVELGTTMEVVLDQSLRGKTKLATR
jgi:transposase